MSEEKLREAARVLRERALSSSQGPWFWNSYSAVHSAGEPNSDDWEEEKLEEGHSLDKWGACAACGAWTWDYTNPKTGEVTTYDGKGCELWGEAYDRDTMVAYVPAKYGDTARGRHANDAQWIETMHPGVGLAVAGWLDAEANTGMVTGVQRFEALRVARMILGEPT